MKNAQMIDNEMHTFSNPTLVNGKKSSIHHQSYPRMFCVCIAEEYIIVRLFPLFFIQVTSPVL